MPRILVKGMPKEDLKKISKELFDTIATIIERPREAFTLDLVESVSILDGEELNRVHIEISWVSRPTEVCQKVAEATNELLKQFNYDKVIIYFKNIDLEKEFQF